MPHVPVWHTLPHTSLVVSGIISVYVLFFQFYIFAYEGAWHPLCCNVTLCARMGHPWFGCQMLTDVIGLVAATLVRWAEVCRCFHERLHNTSAIRPWHMWRVSCVVWAFNLFCSDVQHWCCWCMVVDVRGDPSHPSVTWRLLLFFLLVPFQVMAWQCNHESYRCVVGVVVHVVVVYDWNP